MNAMVVILLLVMLFNVCEGNDKGAVLIPNSKGCWLKCGKKGGSCPTVCGKDGFCCRKGYEDCPEDYANLVPFDRHACVHVIGNPGLTCKDRWSKCNRYRERCTVKSYRDKEYAVYGCCSTCGTTFKDRLKTCSIWKGLCNNYQIARWMGVMCNATCAGADQRRHNYCEGRAKRGHCSIVEKTFREYTCRATCNICKDHLGEKCMRYVKWGSCRYSKWQCCKSCRKQTEKSRDVVRRAKVPF